MWPRAWRPPSRSSPRCATRSRSWPTQAAKPAADYPLFPDYHDDVYDAVASVATDELAAALTIARQGRAQRPHRRDQGRGARRGSPRRFEGREKEIGAAFRSLTKKLVRQRILTDHFRIDGRGITDIRALSAEVAVIPRAHGSALFERGETQILGVTTLDMVKMAQQIDSLGPENVQALHAPLQLPAVLDRRDRPGRFAQAARDRPRRAGRAGPDAGAAQRRGVPVRHPSGLRGAELQRLDLDGLGLRLHAVAAERRCAAEGPGRRYRDGPGLRRGRVDGETERASSP